MIISYDALRNSRDVEFKVYDTPAFAARRRDISRKYSLKYIDIKKYLQFSGGIANSNDCYRKARNTFSIFPDDAIRPRSSGDCDRHDITVRRIFRGSLTFVRGRI